MINKPQLVPGVHSGGAPAAAATDDAYVLAWKNDADTAISWTSCRASQTQDSYEWRKAAQVAEAGTSAEPALATFKGNVWMAWKGESDTRIFVASLDGSTWSKGEPVSGIGTSAAPALAAVGSDLFLAWKGERDNQIFWAKSSDGKEWSKSAPVPDAKSDDAPSLSAHKDVVYLGWKSESSSKIMLSTCSDGKAWGKAVTLSDAVATSHRPALGFSGAGRLHLAWKGAKDNFVWMAELPSDTDITGATHWPIFGKLVAVETDASPVLASGGSATTEVLLAWKNKGSADLLVGPVDMLHRILPLPPGAKPFSPNKQEIQSLSWAVPVTGFGSGPNRANFSLTLDLNADGRAAFSGEYTDSGSLPIIDAPPQNYSAVIAVMGSGKTAFTFSHSKNDVPTGGAVDQWSISQINASLQQHWADLTNARAYSSCTNSMDLGSFMNEIVDDLKALEGDIEEAVEVVAVIAAMAA